MRCSAVFLKLHWELVIPQHLSPPTAYSGGDISWLRLVSPIPVLKGQSTYFLPELKDLFKEKHTRSPNQNHLQQSKNTEDIPVYPGSNWGGRGGGVKAGTRKAVTMNLWMQLQKFNVIATRKSLTRTTSNDFIF